jgi:ERCC4-related helicase
LIRSKKDCLNLPDKIRSISIVQKIPTLEQEYFQMFKERWSENERKLKSGEIKQGNEALVKIEILRQCSSYFKINKTLEIVDNLLNDGQSVVVFCEFLDTINELEQIFNTHIRNFRHVVQKDT